MDFEMGLWTLALYVLVQQVEGNFLYPVVQRYAVGIPPGLMLFALLAGGLLFGLPGVFLGAPLTVVIYVMVKRLYVREALQTPTDVPGEKDGGG
jgi:predicted PurR-regulated permease PerM